MPALKIRQCASTALMLAGQMLLAVATFAQQKRPCIVQREPSSAAEAALAREDYPAALDLYNKLASEDPDQSKSGVIRTLLGQNKLKDAEDLAQAWLKQEPKSPVATETLGEVFYREGELADVNNMYRATIQLDPCSARNYLLGAQVESLTANFGQAKSHIELAHKLTPDDVEIRSAWIETLPREQRLVEERSLLKDTKLLSPDEKKYLEKDVAKASLPRDECKLVTPVTTAKIAIRSGNYAMAMPVKFNGDTRMLQIDTGASGITLSRLGAVGLGLVREDATTIGGVGDLGTVNTSIAHVANLKIGALEFQNCRVQIVENYQSLDNQGLIGMDVLRNFLITVDIGREQVRLDPLPKRPDEKASSAESLQTDAPAPIGARSGDRGSEWNDRYIAPEMADWTKIYRVGHDLLIPTRLNEKLWRLFILDTGAGSVLLSTDAAKAVSKIRSDPADSIMGISGQVKKVYATGRFRLEFADFYRDIESVAAIDMSGFSHNDGIEESGFLGMPLLRELILHIDYRDNLIKFEKGPIKW